MKTLIRTTFYLAIFLASTLSHAQYNAGAGSGASGTQYTFVGVNAGAVNTGSHNTFIGQVAGRTNKSGNNNTFIGRGSGYRNTSGRYNSFLGVNSGFSNSTGSFNTFIGRSAGFKNTTAGSNVFLGYASGLNTTTGGQNTFVGNFAGYNNVIGTRNVFIGAFAGQNETGSDRLYIDNTSTASPLIHGNFNTDILTVNGSFIVPDDNVGIGTTTPTEQLHIGDGNIRLPDVNGNTDGNVYLGGRTVDSDNGMRLFGGGNFAGFIDVVSNSPIDGLRFRVDQNVGSVERMRITAEGNVGIGVSDPESRLHIAGNNNFGLTVSNADNSSRLQIATSDCTGCLSPFAQDNDQVIRFGGSVDNLIFNTTSNNNIGRAFKFVSNQAILMEIGDDGRVSIGNDIDTPGSYKLYVETGILSEKVKVASVNSADWADYVFEEDYELNSIEEVEQFVKTNKHLPNVPSAKQVEENGIDMVEMDATLLRQVEELWLHVMELNKEVSELKKENRVLKLNK